MKKNVIAFVIALGFGLTAFADEGMWMLPTLQRAKFQPTQFITQANRLLRTPWFISETAALEKSCPRKVFF